LRASSGLKDFVENLRKNGELLTLSIPLSPKFEISAVISELGKKEAPALLFEKVRGYQFPVIGNLLGTKKRLSMALGVDQENFFENALLKLKKRIHPVLVKDRTPKRVILQKEKIDLLKLLPILTHYAGDSGPYITSGMTSVRDPKDGTIGRGLHRMEVRGKNNLGISLLNPPLSEIYAQCKKENRKMEVATVIGVDPAILIALISKVPRGMDKLSVAGGLKGKPIQMVKAETVDVDIPVHAEIVIEGFIDPKTKEKDGTLGESSGYYMTFSKSPMIHVTAITYREGAYFHAIVPWGIEVDNLLCLIHGINFVPKIKEEIPSLRRIHLIPGTFGSHAVMSIETDKKSEVRKALNLALSFSNIKKAIIVDEDIDPEDHQEVEWALATRFQGDRDLIILPDLRGQPIDPSSKEGFLTTKIGMDATRPKKEGFKKVDIPIAVKKRLAPLLKNLKQISPSPSSPPTKGGENLFRR
jgi:2,5-furandicarboxylate decarboxylase 1